MARMGMALVAPLWRTISSSNNQHCCRRCGADELARSGQLPRARRSFQIPVIVIPASRSNTTALPLLRRSSATDPLAILRRLRSTGCLVNCDWQSPDRWTPCLQTAFVCLIRPLRSSTGAACHYMYPDNVIGIKTPPITCRDDYKLYLSATLPPLGLLSCRAERCMASVSGSHHSGSPSSGSRPPSHAPQWHRQRTHAVSM